MKLALDVASATFAFLAAVWWFRSASHALPQPVTYVGYTPGHDPFLQALQAGVRLNRWAALFAGLAASLQVASTLFSVIQRTP